MTRRARIGLATLAMGTFAIATSAFTPIGMLPALAAGTGVSIPAAGLLISAYAMGVAIGAPLLTIALASVERRVALSLLMSFLIVGNLLASASSSYDMLMSARIVTSLCHGAFVGIASVMAGNLVEPQRRASAVSRVFLGTMAANVAGVPAVVWLNFQLGWRAAFVALACIGVGAMAALLFALPRQREQARMVARLELAALVRGDVALALTVTMLGAGAFAAVHTYVVPLLRATQQASDGFVTTVLFFIGAGFCVGNVVGGRLADRSLTFAVLASTVVITLASVALPFVLHQVAMTIITLFIWSCATSAFVAPSHVVVLRAAAAAPTLASSINVSAFSLGTALGAAFGSATLDAGLPLRDVPLVGALLALASGSVVWIASRRGQTAAGNLSG